MQRNQVKIFIHFGQSKIRYKWPLQESDTKILKREILGFPSFLLLGLSVSEFLNCDLWDFVGDLGRWWVFLLGFWGLGGMRMLVEEMEESVNWGRKVRFWRTRLGICSDMNNIILRQSNPWLFKIYLFNGNCKSYGQNEPWFIPCEFAKLLCSSLGFCLHLLSSISFIYLKITF